MGRKQEGRNTKQQKYRINTDEELVFEKSLRTVWNYLQQKFYQAKNLRGSEEFFTQPL